jgi:plasmid stability protein
VDDIVDINMGQMLIRNLDDAVIATLKRRALENRTSAEEEARRVLSAGAAPRFDAEAWRRDAEALAQRIGPLPGPTSLEILRSERYGDEEA